MKTAQARATPPTNSRPFSAALAGTRIGPGEYRAELSGDWVVAGGKVHGGLMLAVVTKAALAGLAERTEGEPMDPLAVSAEFLRAPDLGVVRIQTEVVKIGRMVSVVRANLHQHDRLVLSTTVTVGRLPTEAPVWLELPTMAAEPPPDAVQTAADDPKAPPLARSCDIRIDPATFGRPELRAAVMRGWVRPIGEPADVLFALFVGDVLPPVLINLGLPGWAPTVQLTALLRARPAPGWLRTEVRSRAVGGGWFDEDATVLDADGRLVCQARQLALAPLS
ncbi:MAG: thioesterase family protein [Pseudonocardiales bacterium]|nr:thioesterase family protein [Pseudonocardiales bacterium]